METNAIPRGVDIENLNGVFKSAEYSGSTF